jgi:hypothetical protein
VVGSVGSHRAAIRAEALAEALMALRSNEASDELCLRCRHPYADHTFNYSDRQMVPSCAAKGCTCLAMAWQEAVDQRMKP